MNGTILGDVTSIHSSVDLRVSFIRMWIDCVQKPIMATFFSLKEFLLRYFKKIYRQFLRVAVGNSATVKLARVALVKSFTEVLSLVSSPQKECRLLFMSLLIVYFPFVFNVYTTVCYRYALWNTCSLSHMDHSCFISNIIILFLEVLENCTGKYIYLFLNQL